MKDFFIELFEYNRDCNQKLAELFRTYSTQTTERSTKLYNHVLNVHQVWNSRIEPNQNPFGSWDVDPWQDYPGIDQANYKNSLLILNKYELTTSINYLNTKGQPFSNSVKDILFHMINHSTYHRGQIATEFRQNGLEPLTTDYILYKR